MIPPQAVMIPLLDMIKQAAASNAHAFQSIVAHLVLNLASFFEVGCPNCQQNAEWAISQGKHRLTAPENDPRLAANRCIPGQH